jgi:hypothetical protein
MASSLTFQTWVRALQSLIAVAGRALQTSVVFLRCRDPSASPNQTTFETLLFRTLRNAALPLPTRQFCVWDKWGAVTRLDFAYPDVLLGIPADSFKWHGRRRQWDRDIEQRNRLLALGWRLRPTTWTELKRKPKRFSSDIRRLLSTGPRFVS